MHLRVQWLGSRLFLHGFSGQPQFAYIFVRSIMPDACVIQMAVFVAGDIANVGFRDFIENYAECRGIVGCVCNSRAYQAVLVVAEGTEVQLVQLLMTIACGPVKHSRYGVDGQGNAVQYSFLAASGAFYEFCCEEPSFVEWCVGRVTRQSTWHVFDKEYLRSTKDPPIQVLQYPYMRVPQDVRDTRFLKRRTERLICCDRCKGWYRGNMVGAFFDKWRMPRAEGRREAWLFGAWDASWFCFKCYEALWECSSDDVEKVLGFKDRNLRRKPYQYGHRRHRRRSRSRSRERSL